MTAAAAAAAPAALIRRHSAARLLLLHRRGRNPKTPLRRSPASLHPLPRSSPPPSPLIPNAASSRWRWRLFCSGTLAADADAAAAAAATEGGEGVREFRRRLRIADVKGGASEGVDWLGKELVIRGWVRTCRVQSSVTFIEVNDGSCLSNMQCVMAPDAEGYDQVELGAVTTGASVLVEGVVVSSQGAKQKVELKVARLVMIGKCDPLTYPIQKKRASREFLRTIAHLRPRTNTFGSVTRVRNALAYATHKFFQENGFVWISSPIITASDCEGAGEQFCVKFVLENCKEDMDFFNTWIEKGIIDRLNNVAEKNFVQLTYSEAIELLLRAKRKFDFPVKWGLDLQSEHERYITEIAFGGRPVIIRDYPKEIKAFYMRQNDDGKTVAAMDLLVPRVGELIGGSQREERLDYLEARLDELNLNKENYWWYLDLRRFGSVPHAGFGLGFERLVQFATGIENIRDAIPFPRTPGSAEF
ncbi:Asparagine--tRNA ligase, chloroplastic/mitochondrial [Ananas comosus]|uniref:Asparagine--tRNA ligase, chloroplastic/mitochondrial n=1 Tax=Ananas comosus TaxID=4615 RepID=A0A199UN65_ANACO|nr:Asparagine--tRNA ligase, chloroplastic/mitochondrial [Ananas comosus]